MDLVAGAEIEVRDLGEAMPAVETDGAAIMVEHRQIELGRDAIIVDRLADPEGIAADLAEAVTLVKTPRAVVVDIDAEDDLLGAVAAGMLERPLHHHLGDTRALPRAEHIELIELDRVGPPFA